MSDEPANADAKGTSLPGRIAKYTGLTLLGLVIASAIAFVAFDLDGLAAEQRDLLVPQLSEELGRDVEIGEITTSKIPLRATIRDIRVAGATPDAPPLVVADAVEVRIDLWQAVITLGGEIDVEGVTVDGLAIELQRGADGTLSYQDVLDRLVADASPANADVDTDAPAGADSAATDEGDLLDRVSLERVAVRDASVRLVDRSTPGPEPTVSTVDSLTLLVEGVALGETFDLDFDAAILSDATNLEIDGSGVVSRDAEGALGLALGRLDLTASGVEIGRVAPYLGADAARVVRSATLDGELIVRDLVSDAPEARIEGDLTVGGVRLGDPPGPAFDVVVAPQIAIDRAADRLTLDGSRLAVGAATIRADGAVTRLDAPSPGFEGLAVRSEDLDLGRLSALAGGLIDGLPEGARLDGPVRLEATAGGTAEAQAITATIDLSDATLGLPPELDKDAGEALVVTATAEVDSGLVDVERLSLSVADAPDITAEARFDLDASALTGTIRVPTLRLGALGSVFASLRGDPLVSSTTVSATARVSADPAQPSTLRVATSDLAVQSAAGAVSGSLQVADLAAPRITFDLTSDRLDVDALAGEGGGASDATGAEGAEGGAAAGSGASPIAIPPALRALRMSGDLAVGRAVVAGKTFSNVEITARLSGGVLTVTRFDAGVWGGDADLAPTTVSFEEEALQVASEGGISNVDLLAILAPDVRKIAGGMLTFDADLETVGATAQEMLRAASGTLELSLREARLETLNVPRKVVERLVARIPRLDAPRLRLAGVGPEDLRTKLRIDDGVMALERPITFATPIGELTLDGRISVDFEVHLSGTVALAPSFLADLTDGHVRPAAPIHVTVSLGGPLSDPRVTSVGLDELLDLIKDRLISVARERVTREVEERVGPLRDTLKRRMEDKRESMKSGAKKALEERLGGWSP